VFRLAPAAVYGRGLLAAAILAAATSTTRSVDIPTRGTDQIAHFCIVAFGGKERWQQVRDLSFQQVVVRYGPDRKPMGERTSRLYLRYQPRRQCRIESLTDDGKPHLVVYDGEKARVEVGGKEDTNAAIRRKGVRSALSALYLFSLPFPLQDPGVVLSYRGKGSLDGRQAYLLHADASRGSTPSPASTYDFYVDAETYQIPQLTYTVASDSVTYVVRWSDYQNIGGILRPVRWDYMASPRQIAMSVDLREMKINANLADALFRTGPGRAARDAGAAQKPPPR